MRSGFEPLTRPRTGPSRVPLPSIYKLIEYGFWMAHDGPDRDRSNDMTDDQIAAAIASVPTVGRADGL